MLSKIATVTLFTAAAAQYGAPATTTVVAANGYQPGVVETTAVAAEQAVYYYADYDNVVAVANNGIYYQSALTPEAVDRTKQGNAAEWSPAKKAISADFYDAKGAAFCGEKGQPAMGEMWDNTWGAKFKQVFVADAGEEGKNNGAVYGWEVKEDPMNPAAVVLSGKWTVYEPADGAAPVDVKCGPNNGLFIADQYQNAVNWVGYDALVAKKANPDYKAVVPADCGAAVADVRSLSYDAENEQLLWSNNAAVESDAGVFKVDVAKDASPSKVSCDMAACSAGWSSDCSAKVKQVQKGEMGKQIWAVADAWNDVQVSKGDENIYNAKGNVVAEADEEATYAVAAEDPKRDVLVVADQKAGEVYVAANGADAKKIGEVNDVYGVAYNDAYGWNGQASASTVSLAVSVVLAVAVLLL